MKESVADQKNFCSACFDVQYPIAISQETPQKHLFERDEEAEEEKTEASRQLATDG
jgi:glutamine phosphoribosylpyrophosphate amidotransferase